MGDVTLTNTPYDDVFHQSAAGNGGGSVRPTVGVQLPWRQFAADRLVTSLALSRISIFGVSGTNRKCFLS